MQRIYNQLHEKETFFYSISRMLERASYYGLRSLVVFYMTGEILKMEDSEAFGILGVVSISLLLSGIIGALLGDLLLGNRKLVIIGGVSQAIGAFVLCIPSFAGLYAGLFFFVLGSGFYMPNLTSIFGKLYLSKTKLLDSGFTILYLAANLGSFLGVLLIGFSFEKFGFRIGFVISGVLMLLSLLPVICCKEQLANEVKKLELSLSKRVIKVVVVLLAVGIFWSFYEISNIHSSNLLIDLSDLTSFYIPKLSWYYFDFIFLFLASAFAIVLWSHFYSSQFFKLFLGFIFGALSFLVLLLIPEKITEGDVVIYLISVLFLCISEVHIAPMIHSVLTKYSNPKYLAILISFAFLPTRLFNVIFGLFNDRFYEDSFLGAKIGMITMFAISFGLLIYIIFNRKSTQNINMVS